MKIPIITVLLCILVVFSFAQQQPSTETQNFRSYSDTIENQRRAASAKKDYPEAIRLITQWIGEYEHVPAEIKHANQGLYVGMYYNLACYQNLAGKKKAALTNFEKAVTLGYSDYAGTLKDLDLQSLHNNRRFRKAVQQMREKSDMNYVLKHAPAYRNEIIKDIPIFTYQSATAPELVALRKDFNLDSVAGKGDEISRIKNLLLWAHNAVRHDGNSPENPPSRNARDLIAVCKKENKGINCRMIATILRDAYQAEGFKSRMVTCLPKDSSDIQ